MGHHFVPQAYLRAFEDPNRPGMIWVYSRSGALNIASIAKVAQSAGFYDASDEAALNTHVERPANPLLERLRDGQQLARDEKRVLSIYIATMMHRVPRNRERGEEVMPKALAEAAARAAEYVNMVADAQGLSADRRAYLLSQIEPATASAAAHPSPEVLAQVRSPWPSAAVVEKIFGMTWRVLLASPPEAFITSDNPVFIFSSRGLGNPDSELVLPLSPTRCLHGSWRSSGTDEVTFLTPVREVLREMNRRTARDTTSIMLSHRRSPELLALLKRKPRVNKLLWG